MTSKEISSDSEHRHALRLYGAFCIGGNLLLLSKGIAMHDPIIIAAGATGATGQITNAVFGNSVKPYTVPVLMLGAALFGVAGMHAQPHNFAHVVFGAVKDAGLATLFYGCRIPALRMMRNFHPELVGEALLAVATTALSVDGAQQLVEGMATHNVAKAINGILTLGASAGFFAGQRYASKLQRHERLALSRPAVFAPGPLPE